MTRSSEMTEKVKNDYTKCTKIHSPNLQKRRKCQKKFLKCETSIALLRSKCYLKYVHGNVSNNDSAQIQ